jgi:acetyl esterase/lipase
MSEFADPLPVKHFLLATALALSPCFALAQSAQVVELASRPGVKEVVLVVHEHDHMSARRQQATHARQEVAVSPKGKPVWLVGHSRGTHSAVTAALRLQGDNAPDGIVLAAPMLDSNRFAGSTAKPLQESGVEGLRVPALVLQHAKDACPVAAPAKLPELQAKLPPATSKVISYDGGISRGALCDVQAFHSFNGIEARVVDDLSAHIGQRK